MYQRLTPFAVELLCMNPTIVLLMEKKITIYISISCVAVAAEVVAM